MADVRTLAFIMVMDMQSNAADKDFTHINGTVVNRRILESNTMHSQTPRSALNPLYPTRRPSMLRKTPRCNQ